MIISELEAKLKELREKHGDLPVFIPTRNYEYDYYECSEVKFEAKAHYDPGEYEDEVLMDMIQLDYC